MKVFNSYWSTGFKLSILAIALLACLEGWGCTSAIVGAGRSDSRCSLLWKHRDTGAKANYIAHHAATDSTFEYIALHNDTDTLGLEAWIGMNRAGLAIMNTATYNLMPDTATVKDCEGFVMTEALKRCVTVDDVAALLDSLPRPMGVQANFGVIDAHGGATYFETHDHGYRRYEAPDDEITVRTNYSHSGGAEKRLGRAREQTAISYFKDRHYVSPTEIIDSLSRVYRLPDGKLIPPDKLTGNEAKSGNCIPRTISTASIVIEALPSPACDGTNYIMWYVLGFPPDGKLHSTTFNSP